MNGSDGYFVPIAGRSFDYVETSTADDGYTPDDDSPRPDAPFYIVPLPSPPASSNADVGQEPTTACANQTSPGSPGSNSGYLVPCEDNAAGENKTPLDESTTLQLRENNVGSSSTDSVRASSQLTDNGGDLSPIVKHQSEQSEINYQLPSFD